MKPRKIGSMLTDWGFQIVRQRGSHQQWRHADGRRTTLSIHPGRDISPILIRKIAKDIGLAVDIFLAGPDTDHS